MYTSVTSFVVPVVIDPHLSHGLVRVIDGVCDDDLVSERVQPEVGVLVVVVRHHVRVVPGKLPSFKTLPEKNAFLLYFILISFFQIYHFIFSESLQFREMAVTP